MRRFSPNPNKNNPKTRKMKVKGFGFKLKESSELQSTLGIFLIVKVSEISFIRGE
jgi:hypothetical protein